MFTRRLIFHRFTGLAALIFLLAFSGVAFAAESQHPIDRWFDGQDPLTTPDTLEVLAEAERKWDAELNVQYKNLMGKLTPEGRKRLQDSQRKWIAHRDAEFKLLDELHGQWYEEAGGGTMWSIVHADCRMNFVRSRVLFFLEYLGYFSE